MLYHASKLRLSIFFIEKVNCLFLIFVVANYMTTVEKNQLFVLLFSLCHARPLAVLTTGITTWMGSNRYFGMGNSITCRSAGAAMLSNVGWRSSMYTTAQARCSAHRFQPCRHSSIQPPLATVLPLFGMLINWFGSAVSCQSSPIGRFGHGSASVLHCGVGKGAATCLWA